MAVSGGDGGGGRTQLLAAVETSAMTVFTGSSPVFPIPLCFLFFSLLFFFFLSLVFFSFSSLGSLLSIPIMLLSSFSLFLFVFFSLLPLYSFSSSFVFSFLSFFWFFFLFTVSSFFLSLFSFFRSLFCSLFPCIHRKNKGERGRGGHCAAAPKATRGARSLLFSPPRGRPRVRGYTSGFIVDVFLMLFGERGREKSVKKRSSSSPASHIQGKKKTHCAVQNGTIRVFFFREKCMKRRRFI